MEKNQLKNSVQLGSIVAEMLLLNKRNWLETFWTKKKNIL